MLNLIATDWMWIVAVLLAGGVAVGYWLPRRSEGGFRRVAFWGVAACFTGLAAAILDWSNEPDLETPFWLAFDFAGGGFLGGWLRAAAEQAKLRRLARDSHARVESAMLGARAKATVMFDQDLDASTQAIEVARLAVEAKAAGLARIASAAKAGEAAKPEEAPNSEENSKAEQVARTADDQPITTRSNAVEGARIAAADEPAEGESVDRAELAGAAGSEPADAFHPGSRPLGIAALAEGEADDLKLIKGIGPRNEKACNALGIFRFRQIADWTPDEAVWVGHHLAFPGRIEREHWSAQAALLASGFETDYSRAVKSGTTLVDDSADEPLDPLAADMLGRSLPERVAPIDGERKHPGRRPPGITTALGNADDLKRIRGIGPRNAGRLHQLGIWHFSQIAAWTDDNVKWVGSYLAFSGRIHRENWVAQARELAAGNEPRREIARGTSKDGAEASLEVATAKLVASKDPATPEKSEVRPPK